MPYQLVVSGEGEPVARFGFPQASKLALSGEEKGEHDKGLRIKEKFSCHPSTFYFLLTTIGSQMFLFVLDFRW